MLVSFSGLFLETCISQTAFTMYSSANDKVLVITIWIICRFKFQISKIRDGIYRNFRDTESVTKKFGKRAHCLEGRGFSKEKSHWKLWNSFKKAEDNHDRISYECSNLTSCDRTKKYALVSEAKHQAPFDLHPLRILSLPKEVNMSMILETWIAHWKDSKTSSYITKANGSLKERALEIRTLKLTDPVSIWDVAPILPHLPDSLKQNMSRCTENLTGIELGTT